jgi:hypothetical protein
MIRARKSMWEMLCLVRDLQAINVEKRQFGGTINVEINNVIYMELYSGPKMAHSKYEKMNIAGSIVRNSTVHTYIHVRVCVCVYVYVCVVLEMVLINGIKHLVFSQGFMNTNQYGLTPQKGTIDAAMEVKDFVKEVLAAGEVIALVSLYLKGTFDAVWWPGILKELRDCGWPKYLYELTKSYFNQRTATLSTNSV